jgi:aryl-alcohol dehydrogenase-like predicted oxidoreductase
LSGRDEIASEEQFELIAALERYAEERGRSLLELAFGALLAQPAVSSVIAGATKPEQVATNAAAGQWIPDRDDLSGLQDLLASSSA